MDTKIFFFLMLLMLAVSCVKQDHNNPFDSQCPKELWTPTDFKATLEGTTVKLTWTQTENRISGFKLTKKVDTGTETALTNQSKDANQLTDASLTGGKVHVYTLVAYAGNNQSNVVTTQIAPAFQATLTTTSGSSITANSLVMGGNITSDGGSPVLERGVCWGPTTNPITTTNKVPMGSGSGSFSGTISGLSPSTPYYFRAYAVNSLGTAYGNEVTATMLSALPTLTTTVVSAITPTTATSGGNITYEGISSVTVRGVCWSTTQNPTTANSKTSDGTGPGTFTSNLTGLTPGKQYYVKAYATNGTGTGYGNEQVFTSTAPVLTITPANQDVTNVAGSTSFAITSNVSWTASSNQTWCIITNLSGTGNATLAVTYDANATNSQRIATLTITGLGMAAKTVTVTQLPAFPISGLVAYYPFNGNASDESGNGNNGTIYGVTLTTDRKGKENSAYSFDGIDTYIKCGNNSILNFSNSEFTVSVWANCTDYTGYFSCMVIKLCSDNSLPKYRLGHSGYISSGDFTYFSNTNTYIDILSNSNYYINTWALYTVVVKLNAILFYKNGTLFQSISNSLNNMRSDVGGDFLIGKNIVNSSFFKGKLDDIRIYNRALTESEIQLLYIE